MKKNIKAQVNTEVATTATTEAVESNVAQGLTKKRGTETIESLEAQLGVKIYFKEHIDKKEGEDKYHVVVESRLGFSREYKFNKVRDIAPDFMAQGHKLDNRKFNKLFEMQTDLLKQYIKGNFHTGIGWHEYNGKQLFLYREAASKSDKLVSEYKGNLEIKAAGTLNTYIEEIKKQVVPYPKLLIVYLAGASGIINQQLGIVDSNIMLGISGGSGSGKTTAENVAMSFWGNPVELSTSFNSTVNRTEQVLSERFIMPVIVDDVLAGNNFSTDRTKQKVIGDQIFRYSTGKLKARLNQYEDKYYGATIVSSETSLFQKLAGSEADGQFYRMIELRVEKGELTKDAEHARKLEKLIRWNYGLGAFELGKYMVEQGYVGKKLQDLYEEQYKSLVEDTRLKGDQRTANRLAILTTTAKLMNDCFKMKINMNVIKEVLINSILTALDIKDMNEKYYNDLHKLVLSNPDAFVDSQDIYDRQKHMGVYKLNAYGNHELLVETDRIAPLIKGVTFKQILAGLGSEKVKQSPSSETLSILGNWRGRGWLDCSIKNKTQHYRKRDMGARKQVLVYVVIFDTPAGENKETATKGGEV